MKTCLLFVLLFSLLIPIASAQEEIIITAEVVYDGVNLRNYPFEVHDTALDLDSEVITVMNQGTQLIVLAIFDWTMNWIQVTIQDTEITGWVYKDFIQFNRADWRTYVPVVGRVDLFPEVQQPPMIATVSPYNLNVHSSPPLRNSNIIGIVEVNTQVYVYYERMDDNMYDPIQVYIETLDGHLAGWVYTGYLDFPSRYHRGDLPMIDFTLPGSPISIQGQGIGYVSAHIGLNLRSAPSTDSPKIRTLDKYELLALHGRTTHTIEGWLYVTVIETGENGWVYDPQNETPRWVIYPVSLTFDTISLISSNTPQKTTLSGVNTMTAITIDIAPLREFTNIYVDIFAVIPSNTTLTLTGRNINGEWYKTSYDGWEGWVWYGNLDFDGEPYRLPIISLHEGRTSGQ